MDWLNREIPSFHPVRGKTSMASAAPLQEVVTGRASDGVHAAAVILILAAFLSKLLGLLRDRLLASSFGAGDILDAYYAAFQIPDILYTIFLIAAASAAVLPVFLKYKNLDPGQASELIQNLLTIFGIASIIITALTFLLAPALMNLIAPGFSGAKLDLAVKLTRLMSTNAFFLGVASILGAVLQAHHRFFVFAALPILYNLGIIAGIVILVPLLGPIGLAYGVISGGLLQVLIELPVISKLGLSLRPKINFKHPGIKEIVLTSLPRVAALSFSAVTLLILTAIASRLESGSIAVFKLAFNLLYVPVGLFGVSYALAVFPKLSMASVSGKPGEFAEHFYFGFKNILLWTMPLLALFIVLRAHIVRVGLGAGLFDWTDTRLVAASLAILSLAIFSESLIPLILRAFYALGKTWEPLWWDIFASLLTIGLALGLILLFGLRPVLLQNLASLLRIGDLEKPMVMALVMAFSAGSILNFTFLFLALRKTVKQSLDLKLGIEIPALAKMLAAAVFAGAVAYFVLMPFPALVPTNTFAGIFIQGFISGLMGIGAYFGMLWIMKSPEVMSVVLSFRRRLDWLMKIASVSEVEKLNGESGK